MIPTEGESWLISYNEISPCRRPNRWLGSGSCRCSLHLHEPSYGFVLSIISHRTNMRV